MNEQGSGTLGVVVVGVDGSDASRDALAWAGRYARLTGATVHAATAWEYPAELAFGMVAVPDFDPEGDARRLLKEAVGEVLEGREPVAVRTSVVHGPAGRVLERLAEAADLLVVGSRGHGVVAGVLLGSVSEHCVHHTRCPVVVVHHHDTPASPQPAS
jgi:nucleotide-binding universal stress UspA family protein